MIQMMLFKDILLFPYFTPGQSSFHNFYWFISNHEQFSLPQSTPGMKSICFDPGTFSIAIPNEIIAFEVDQRLMVVQLSVHLQCKTVHLSVKLSWWLNETDYDAGDRIIMVCRRHSVNRSSTSQSCHQHRPSPTLIPNLDNFSDKSVKIVIFIFI